MAKNNILIDIIFRSRNKKLNSKKLRESPEGVYVNQYVDIGGIQQWITIRGDNPNNPILLFVQGGPGSPYSMFNPLISFSEEHFTIVLWDQRGAGKTFSKNSKCISQVISEPFRHLILSHSTFVHFHPFPCFFHHK